MTRTAHSTARAAQVVEREPSTDAIAGVTAGLREISPSLSLEEVRCRRWQSVTFDGTRMELRLRATSPEEAKRVAEGLDTAAFAIRGHVVADVCGWADDCAVRVEALTVDD